jgi:hypothetical protein
MSLTSKIREHSHASQGRSVWEEFCRDERLLRAHNITPEEMESLRRVALMGPIVSKQDLIFMLGTIRRAGR